MYVVGPLDEIVWILVCMCARARARVCVCLYARACACMHACMHVNVGV